MSLLKRLLLFQGIGAGGVAIPIFPIEYIFTEGTSSPYNIKYDDEEGSGAYTIATSEDISTTGVATQRKIIRQSDGILYAIYRKQLAGLYQIYVKKSVDDGVNWTDEQRVSVNASKHMESYDQAFPAMAVDSSDELHVVWEGYNDDYTTMPQIWYVKYDGSWSVPLRISTNPTCYKGGNASIAIDSDDYIHVVYDARTFAYPTRYQIFYKKYDGSWSAPLRISTLTDMEDYSQSAATIEIDSGNNLHVAFRGSIKALFIYYTKYDGSWSVPISLSSLSTTSVMSIAIDSSDNIHIVYTGTFNPYPALQIIYRKYDGSWQAEVRLSDYAGMENFVQLAPTIAIDADDNLHVLWYGKATGYIDENKIWYAEYIVSWLTPVVLQPTGAQTLPSLRWSRFP